MLRTTAAVSLFLASALGLDLTINTITDYETFMANPDDYGNVYLGADLDFSGKTVTPINNFGGMFYGNGHVIKNLKMSSTEKNVGIFGKLQSVTVKDLIIDSTCSFTGTYASALKDTISIGSVVGVCEKCTFENIINYASTTYNPSTANTQAGSVYVGGIAGSFSSDTGSGATMKNVANFGDVTNNYVTINTDDKEVFGGAGGIAGYSLGLDKTKRAQFTNCLNYGKVTTKNTRVLGTGTGGIVGVVMAYPAFKNIVSAGEYENVVPHKGTVVGIGSGQGSITWSNCYVPNTLPYKQVLGNVGEGFTNDVNDATEFTYTEGQFDNLNSEAGYTSLWLNNKDGKKISFQVNDNTLFTSDAKIILTPVLSSHEGKHPFKGWFTDDYCTASYKHNQAAASDRTLHGGWEFTLTLTSEGGNLTNALKTKKVVYKHKYGSLPTLGKEGYTFAGWFDAATGGNKVTEETVLASAKDANIYAQWTINQYTVTYLLNNGTDDVVETYDYKAKITYIASPTWEEHEFVGWVSTDGSNWNSKNMPARNLVINGTWKLVKYPVTFNYYEGKTETKDCDYGSEIVYPDPAREGYTFLGWDNDITTVPSGGITITGSWRINIYAVTFDYANGTTEVFELEYGTPINYPENITRKGFKFSGWSTAKTHPTMPAENFTAFAEYSKNVFTYTFTKDGKTVVVIPHAFDNATFELPKAPKKTLYKFEGWCLKDGSLCDPTIDQLPAENKVEFQAKYKIDPLPIALIAVAAVIVIAAAVTGFLVWFIKRKKSRARRKVPPKKKDVEMDS